VALLNVPEIFSLAAGQLIWRGKDTGMGDFSIGDNHFLIFKPERFRQLTPTFLTPIVAERDRFRQLTGPF